MLSTFIRYNVSAVFANTYFPKLIDKGPLSQRYNTCYNKNLDVQDIENSVTNIL